MREVGRIAVSDNCRHLLYALGQVPQQAGCPAQTHASQVVAEWKPGLPMEQPPQVPPRAAQTVTKQT